MHCAEDCAEDAPRQIAVHHCRPNRPSSRQSFACSYSRSALLRRGQGPEPHTIPASPSSPHGADFFLWGYRHPIKVVNSYELSEPRELDLPSVPGPEGSVVSSCASLFFESRADEEDGQSRMDRDRWPQQNPRCTAQPDDNE